MSDDNLGLSDEQFWAGPDRETARITSALKAQKFSGLKIGAPTFAATERPTLPIVLFQVASIADTAKYALAKRAIVTGVEVDTGEVFAGRALVEEGVERLKPVPIPPELAAFVDPKPVGTSVAAFTFDAYDQLEIAPGSNGTLLFTVIAMDRVSNRRTTRVGAPASAYDDEAVRAFLEEERIRVGPPPVSPRAQGPQGFPRYERQPESPPAPDEPGIAMRIERVTVTREGARAVLYGTVRAPLGRHQIVPRTRRETAREGGLEETKPYFATVPVSLVVTGSVNVGPVVIPMNVPVYEPVDPDKPPPTVVAHFAIDLLRNGVSKKDQTHFVYAFSRELMAGPTLAAFVSPDRLPR